MSNALLNKARVILIVIRSLLASAAAFYDFSDSSETQPSSAPPPTTCQWIGDRQKCTHVVADLGLFDCNRLARKLAIWKWVSGTPALRLGLNGIAPFESFWWPTTAESAGCPAFFEAYYVPEIEQNSGLITHASTHTRTHTHKLTHMHTHTHTASQTVAGCEVTVEANLQRKEVELQPNERRLQGNESDIVI